jgi:serine phosphatase RsbU (regulator of sigma subunit)
MKLFINKIKKTHIYFLISFFFFLPLLNLFSQTIGGKIHLTEPERVYSLNGTWKFYPQDDFKFASPEYDDLHWSYIKIPGYWYQQGFNHEGVAWYRMSFTVSEKFAEVDLAVMVPFINIAHEFFLNGIKIGGRGSISNDGGLLRASNKINIYYLPANLIKPNEKNQIAFRLRSYGIIGGFLLNDFHIGKSLLVKELYEEYFIWNTLLVGCFLFVGLYFLIIFFGRSTATHYFYFACLSILLALYVLGIKTLGYWIWDNFRFNLYLYYFGITTFTFWYSNFLHRFYRFSKSWFPRAGEILSILLFIAFLICTSDLILLEKFARFALPIALLNVFTFFIYGVYLTFKAIHRNIFGAKIIGYGSFLFAFFITNDIMNYFRIIDSFWLTEEGFFVFILSMAVAMATKFSTIYKNLERTTDELRSLKGVLEVKVDARTRDLRLATDHAEESRKEIQKLNEFTKKINETTDIEEVFESVFNYIRNNFEITSVWIISVDEDKKEFRNFKNFLDSRVPKESVEFLNNFCARLIPETGTLWRTYNRRKPLYVRKIPSVERMMEVDKLVMEKLQLRSFLHVPMIVHDEVLAIICFTNYKSDLLLKRADVKGITRFCDQIAGAIQSTIFLQMAEISNQETKVALAEVEKARFDIEKSYQNVKVLSKIGQDIIGSLSVEKIIDTVYENVNKLMDASVFGIGIYNEKHKVIDCPGFIEKGKKMPTFSIPLDSEIRPALWCFYNQKTVLCNDVYKDFPKYNFPVNPIEGEMPESLIYMPVTYKKKAMGVITVQSFTKNAYEAYHVSILRNLSVYCAIALENAEAYQELNNAYKEIEYLNEFSKKINSTTLLDDVFNHVFEYIQLVFNAEGLILALTSPSKDKLLFYRVSTPQNLTPEQLDFLQNGHIPLNEKGGVIYQTYLRKRSFYLARTNIGIESEADRNMIKIMKVKSLLLYPLIVHNKVIGMLMITSFESRLKLKKFELKAISRFCEQIAGAIYTSSLLKQVNEEKERSEGLLRAIMGDLVKARIIQQSLLPKEMPRRKDLIIESRYIPMEQVGGDLYDFIEFPSGRFGIFIADVSGHGIPAAMISSMAKLVLSIFGEVIPSPSEYLKYLNKFILGKLAGNFLTCFYCIIDREKNVMHYANAGHPPFLHIRDGQCKLHKARGRLIGIFDDLRMEEGELKIQKNDRFLFFTDGITEVFNPQLEEFGIERLTDIALKHKAEPLDRHLDTILNTVTKFQNVKKMQDDVTLVGMEII